MPTKLKTQSTLELYFTTLLINNIPELVFYTKRGIIDVNQVPFIFLQMNDNPERIMRAATNSVSGSGVIRLYNKDMRVDVRTLKNRKVFDFKFPYPFYKNNI